MMQRLCAKREHLLLATAQKVTKGITGAQAFRRFEWLQRVPNKLAWELRSPAKNMAGNFRGMVLSKPWKTAFDVTVRAGEGSRK